MASSLPAQLKSFVVVGDAEAHPGQFVQTGRKYKICIPLEITDHNNFEVAACFSKVASAALLQEQISCYVCSEIPICAPCVVCESTGKTFVNDWCCSCTNSDNVTGMMLDEEYKALTKQRNQANSKSEDAFASADGDIREKYVAAQCTKEFLLNCPCITLFTNFPIAINFCYPFKKTESGARIGVPLMEYKCIFWLCEHPSKVFCPPCVGCVKPLAHCVYSCDDAPGNENARHIMNGEPKCFYCVPNHVSNSGICSAAAFFCFPCVNAYNMEQIFLHSPVSFYDHETGEERLPLWNHGEFKEEFTHSAGNLESTASNEHGLKRRVACIGYTALCCLVPFVGHAITRTRIQQALFPTDGPHGSVNNVLMHKNCFGNLCCDVLFPCCAVAQETYAIQLAEQNYANAIENQSTWTSMTGCSKKQMDADTDDASSPVELEMTKRNE